MPFAATPRDARDRRLHIGCCLSLQQQDSATDEISHNVASAAHGAKGLVGVLDEVTKAVGETRSAAGQVLEASQTVEAAASRLQRGIEGFLGRVAV